MNRHLILVGLPGSGKSSAGRRAAVLLSTDFTDLDDAVEREAGRPIAAIFARMGEAAFRELERAAMDRALEQPAHLIAAGGGWIAQAGNLASAMQRRAYVLYLAVTPAQAAARIDDASSRPLLAQGDWAERLAELLALRASWYAQADCEVDAMQSVEVVAELVVRAARERAGW